MYFALLAEELDKTTSLTLWISVGAVIILALVIVALCFTSKTLSTRTLAMAGVTLALSFVLSLVKFAPVTYGGSITLASMLPIMIFAYFYGFFPALLTGVIFGLLQFISGPYVLTPLTFILDYVLAFSTIAVVPLFKKFVKNDVAAFISGISAAYLLRFLFHFVSGIIYFNLGAIWAELPAETAVGYSALYNIIYLGPDFAIVAVAAFALTKTRVIERLQTLVVQ